MKLIEPPKWNHSFSSINTFTTICEERYAREKLRPWTDTPDSLRGNQIHDALEAWGMAGFDSTVYEEVVHDFADENNERHVLSREVLAQWMDRVRPVAESLHPKQTEFWIRKELDGCTQKLVGKVDLEAYNGPDGVEEPTIVDWKSVKTMRKKLTQTECDRSLQGLIYSWATGIRRVAFVYFTPNHDAEYVLSEYTDAQIQNAKRYVEHTARQIESRWKTGAWRRAFPGGLCSEKWCPAFNDCYPSD